MLAGSRSSTWGEHVARPGADSLPMASCTRGRGAVRLELGLVNSHPTASLVPLLATCWRSSRISPDRKAPRSSRSLRGRHRGAACLRQTLAPRASAKRRFGITMRWRTARRRARLAFDGALFPAPQDGILLDLGGAASKWLSSATGTPARSSLPLGTLVLRTAVFTSDPPAPDEVRAARRYIARMLTAANLPC